MKEFADQVYTETEWETWRECLLILVPTNLVAMNIGVAMDSWV